MNFEFSANTGFLWKDLPFLDRIEKAKSHGFHSVEFHDEPQTTDLSALKSLLKRLELPVNSMNVRMGDHVGCAALEDHVAMAQSDIQEALAIAQDIGARAVHILAGKYPHEPRAIETFIQNLQFALQGHEDLTILIEPVCHEQMPGYFLSDIVQAADIIARINHPRLRIMFDCYHIHQQSGFVAEHFAAHVDKIGHVQIAAAENRAEPFAGALDYARLLPHFQRLGYQGPFGCEYRAAHSVEAGLYWRDALIKKEA